MPIEFVCPECNRVLRVDESDAGRDAICPGCDTAFIVPTPEPVAQPGLAATMPYPASDGAQAQIVPTQIDIANVLRNTWEIFKENALFLIGVTILVLIINGIGGYATIVIRNAFGVGVETFLANVANTAFGFFLGIGMTKILLELARGRPAEIGLLLSGGNVFLAVVVGWILFSLMVVAGFVLLIIPGILFLLMFGQHYFLIIDRQIPVLDAFPESKTITTGNKLTLIALWVVGLVVSAFVTIVTLGIGMLAVAPYFALAGTVAYLMMCGETGGRGSEVGGQARR